MLPSREWELSGQVLQTADPKLALYLPAAHREQLPPSGPVEPAMQVQFVIILLPLPEKLSTGHGSQGASKISAGLVEYFPDAHNIQDEEPFTAFQVPATHA